MRLEINNTPNDLPPNSILRLSPEATFTKEKEVFTPRKEYVHFEEGLRIKNKAGESFTTSAVFRMLRDGDIIRILTESGSMYELHDPFLKITTKEELDAEEKNKAPEAKAIQKQTRKGLGSLLKGWFTGK